MQDFKSNTKKNVKTLLFFVILIALFAGLSIFFEHKIYTDDSVVPTNIRHSIAAQQETPGTIDIVMAGNSLSFTIVSPMDLWQDRGITLVHTGEAGQTIQGSYEEIKKLYETQSPKLVILEPALVYEADEGASGLNDSLTGWLQYHVPLMHFHDVWKSMLGKRYEEENYKGFAIKPVIDPYTEGPYMQETKDREVIPSGGIQYLEAIRKLCEAHGSRLLLVSSASPMNYTCEKHNAIQDYADAHEDVAYIDFNLNMEETGIDLVRDSLDHGDHLNLLGALKITAYLEQVFDRDYDFESHKGDPAYSGWDQLCEMYMSQKAMWLAQMGE